MLMKKRYTEPLQGAMPLKNLSQLIEAGPILRAGRVDLVDVGQRRKCLGRHCCHNLSLYWRLCRSLSSSRTYRPELQTCTRTKAGVDVRFVRPPKLNLHNRPSPPADGL